MSRIDRALKIKEGSTAVAVATGTDSPPDSAAALSQYTHEARDPDRRDDLPSDPTLDSVDFISTSGSPSGSHRVVRRAARLPANPELPARLVTSTSSALSVEQYRRLAAVLHEEQVQSQLKTVMITSALPGDGKTLTVANLALTLSESYKRRVLVIDADLRLPTLHTTLGIANDRGLSEALLDDRELAFVEVSNGLTALTAGNPGPTPLAGLTSNRMREVLEECEARFDWVLIDTSPVGVLPDAQVLGRLVGAVILVIGAGTTPAATVERAIAELGGPDAIFGVVLNRVEKSRIPQAGYYGQYHPITGNK